MRRLARQAAMLVAVSGLLLAQASGGKGAAGHWEGALDTPNGELAMQVDLLDEPGAGWIGAITIPAQNAKGLPLINVKVNGSSVSFGLKAPGDPRFQATLAEGGAKMAGEMEQGPVKLPFQLTRKGEAKIEKAAPIAALSKELLGTWEGALDAGGQQLRLRFVLANDGNAGTGRIFSLDQGNAEIPISSITQDGASVKIGVSVVSGGFEGEMKGNEMTGIWSQNGGMLPLKLTRAAAGK